MGKKVADELMTGLREAIGYVEGRRAKGMRVWEIPPGEIKATRERPELSQRSRWPQPNDDEDSNCR